MNRNTSESECFVFIKWATGSAPTRLQGAQDVVYPIGSHESSLSTSEDGSILDHIQLTLRLSFTGVSPSAKLCGQCFIVYYVPLRAADEGILILGSPRSPIPSCAASSLASTHIGWMMNQNAHA
jgi:hypothetical protein